jgi:hypothetical protein
MIILVYFIYLFIIYLFNILTIYLAPSISNETTAAPDIDRLLLPEEEWPESFVSNATVKDVIREIPEYIPMNISSIEGKPKNIDLSTYWNPLRIFLLFFSFPIFQIICDSINSFAFRNHIIKNPWKTIHSIPCVTEYSSLGDFLFGLLPSDFIYLPAS